MPKETESTPVRERLLNTAADLFYKEGIQAVGIQRVIQEADAAKASLYAHFPSKDDLVAAYLERSSTQVQERFKARLARVGADPRARVLAFFDVLIEWSQSKEFRGCPFTMAAAELGEGDHPGRTAIHAHRVWLRGLLRQEVAATGLPDPDQITEALMVMLDGAAATHQLDGTRTTGETARWAAERVLGTR